MNKPRPAYTKSRLIKELAFRAGITKVASRQILETLAEIIKRETPNGPFILPGLCKFEVVPRKARRLRNPRTGEALILPPQNALKLTAARSAKLAIAPRIPAVPAAEYKPEPEPAPEPEKPETPAALATPATPETPATPATPETPEKTEAPETPATTEAPATPATTEAPETPVTPEPLPEAISFKCPGCGQEIEAPSDAIGLDAECPMCGRIVVVPAKSEPGTMYGPTVGDAPKSVEPVVSSKEAEAMDPAKLKNRTIRIDAEALGFGDAAPERKPQVEERLISFFCPNCKQEIEATSDMAGTPAECPNCGLTFEVPFFSEAGSIHDEHRQETETKAQAAAQKGKTMRIDLPDDF